ncbi:MAG: radical SAM protein [Planctomycetes bacterium]|nr:radical SAM protein [Planctomycetota bacterium]
MPSVPALRLLFWETTAGCNLECVHCRRLDVSHELMKTDLTTAEGRTLIDQVASVGRPVLVFSGGEPLMRPDVFDLAAHAKARGLLIALATNGTLVDAALAERIAATGFDRVSASLDGAGAATHDAFRGLAGSFDRTMEGLAQLRRAGVPTQINCTIAKHNKDQIEAVLRLAERLGAVAAHYFLLVPVGCGEQIADDQMLDTDEVEERLELIARLERTTALQIKPTCAPHYYRVIRQQAKAEGRRQPVRIGGGEAHPPSEPGSVNPVSQLRSEPGSVNPAPHDPTMRSGGHPHGGSLHSITKGCLAGTAVCFVSHDGEVFPCGYLPVSAGNVRRQHFADIWRDSRVFNEFRDPGTLTGKCGRCEYKMVCSGCRARAFYQYGDYLAEEPYCAFEPTRQE